MEDPLSLLAAEHAVEQKKNEKKNMTEVEKELLAHEQAQELAKDSTCMDVIPHPTIAEDKTHFEPIRKKRKKKKKKAEPKPVTTTQSKKVASPVSEQQPTPENIEVGGLEDEWQDRGDFPGESTVLSCPFLFVSPDKRIQTYGSLTITSYQIYFEPDDPKSIPGGAQTLAIPVASVAKYNIQRFTRGDKVSVSLNVVTRDRQNFTYIFTTSRSLTRRTNYATPEQVDQMLNMMAFPKNTRDLFAFYYFNTCGVTGGWNLYDPLLEYSRMGIDVNLKEDQMGVFRVTNVNEDYAICSTYPQILCTTGLISDDELRQVALFRNRGRIPVLTWKNPGEPISMFRCSQPKVGVTQNRNSQDERYLKTIVTTNSAQVEPLVWVLDCRPKLYAVGNMVKGAGYENMDNYACARLQFLNIDNIHGIREAREKLSKVIFSGKQIDKWMTQIENTGWLKYTCVILKATYLTIKIMSIDKCSTVIHCSDGWDRTSQICALSQMCMDPYYRTLEGFLVLIDKDWLSFGHQFHVRTGHTVCSEGVSQQAPIFDQYLEVCAEIIRQFPSAFEFTDDLLIIILKHLYSCRFGTFLFNSEKERRDNDVSNSTVSLWHYLLNHPEKESFMNPFFRPTKTILFPLHSSKNIRFWEKYYLSHSPEALYMNRNRGAADATLRSIHRDLQKENLQLNKEIVRIREESEIDKQQLNEELLRLKALLNEKNSTSPVKIETLTECENLETTIESSFSQLPVGVE